MELGLQKPYVSIYIYIYLPAPPQLPFKTPQIPSNRDHKALNRVTFGGLGTEGMVFGTYFHNGTLNGPPGYDIWNRIPLSLGSCTLQNGL